MFVVYWLFFLFVSVCLFLTVSSLLFSRQRMSDLNWVAQGPLDFFSINCSCCAGVMFSDPRNTVRLFVCCVEKEREEKEKEIENKKRKRKGDRKRKKKKKTAINFHKHLLPMIACPKTTPPAVPMMFDPISDIIERCGGIPVAGAKLLLKERKEK